MKTVRFMIVISAMVLVPKIVLAGAANATITCRSLSTKGGVINLAGSIPGDLAEFELSLEKNKAEKKLASENEDDIVVVDDFDNRVFTMIVHSKAGSLIMYAIPRTILTRKGRDGSLNVRFSAVVREAPNPGGGDPLRDVKMSCTYEYSV